MFHTRKRNVLCCVGLVASLFLVSSALAKKEPKAKLLNKTGLKHYKAKKYEKAIEVFKKAIEVDASFAWPHFNLACTYGIVISQGSACEFDVNKDMVIKHLSMAIKIKPSIKNKLMKDKDLTPVRNKVGFQQLLGRSLKKDKDIKIILTKVTWHMKEMTGMGPSSNLSFSPRGRMVEIISEPDDDGNLKRTKKSGHYKVKKSVIIGTFKGESPKKWVIGESGVLKSPDSTSNDFDYIDETYECGT